MKTPNNDAKTAQRAEPGCENVRFDVLLFGDEESVDFLQSQRHVETCPHCQEQLEKTAADDRDWNEARSILQTREEDAAAPGESGSFAASRLAGTGARAGRFQLDFLSPAAHPELLGQLGRYQIEQVIGAGGMGVVLKGFDTELNRPVAIKVLAPHLAHSGAARQRFAREARAAAAVVHEHVVTIHNVETEQETPFLVMQYVPGRSLQDRVEREGALAPEEILRIGRQAAAGLAAAHAQGVIHRDVKPANILLENGVERALLTDFGLARAADDASLTHSGVVAGTPQYMSPEQARGESADARSDLFSLGAVLYFMATGHAPFRAEQAMAVLNRICNDRHRPVTEVNPKIPDELADAIDRLLEKRPGRRFATAGEVDQALADALKQMQSPSRWRGRRWLRRLRRERSLFGYVAAVVAIIVASVGWHAGWFGPSHATVQDAPHSGPAKSDPAQSHTATAALPDIDTFALEVSTRPAEFNSELAAIDEKLQQLAAIPYPESTVLRPHPGSWWVDFSAARQEAERQEQAWPVKTFNSPSLNSMKGKNP